MAKPFKQIGIFGRTGGIGVNQTLKELVALLISHHYPVWIEQKTADSMENTALKFSVIDQNQLNQYCDLLIVVGGDGSLLHAAHIAVPQELPVLGINRGNLGFLTDILPNKMNTIIEILQGNYLTEQRFLLTTTVEKNQTIQKDNALNEVVILPHQPPHMIEFEIYVNQEFICSQHGDGLIIATPTGSTAYALSGGGPILHPQLDAIVLVPMFPHTLSHRPIVIDGKSHVEVKMSPKNKYASLVSCDGRTCIPVSNDSSITIVKNTLPLQLIHPVNYRYFESLRSKLHWGKKFTEMG